MVRLSPDYLAEYYYYVVRSSIIEKELRVEKFDVFFLCRESISAGWDQEIGKESSGMEPSDCGCVAQH